MSRGLASLSYRTMVPVSGERAPPASRDRWAVYGIAGLDERIRYVGCTVRQLHLRLSGHISAALRAHRPTRWQAWLQGELAARRPILIVEIWRGSVRESAFKRERDTIAGLNAAGACLLNEVYAAKPLCLLCGRLLSLHDDCCQPSRVIRVEYATETRR
jgi:hypothetical protein